MPDRLLPAHPGADAPAGAADRHSGAHRHAASPNGYPYPLPADWDLTRELEQWQKDWLLAEITPFWDVWMHPETGIRDCNVAIPMLHPDATVLAQGLLELCTSWQSEGTFVKEPPMSALGISFYTSAERQRIVVRFDT